jgi:hypothetical protein
MFEDILGKDNYEWKKDLFSFDENTIVVCPECGVEMISTIVNDEDEFNIVDYEEPCRQCGWTIIENKDITHT